MTGGGNINTSLHHSAAELDPFFSQDEETFESPDWSTRIWSTQIGFWILDCLEYDCLVEFWSDKKYLFTFDGWSRHSTKEKG